MKISLGSCATRKGSSNLRHAHARARWTGRTLRVQIEGWVDGDTSVADADRLGQLVADRIAADLPDVRSFTWSAHSA